MERINELYASLRAKENNLHDTNDLALAQLEGEDMEGYGDVIEYRHQLRVEIKALKAEINALKAEVANQAMEDDEENADEQYDEWYDLIGYFVEFGQIVSYGDSLYKVIIPHTVQSDWTPTDSNLYKPYSDEEWASWHQPAGAHDAYNTGDKVSHDGKHWQSLVDGNAWEPSTALPTVWQLISDEG